MKLIQTMVNNKLKVVTADELLKYAEQFDVKLTRKDAEKLVNYLRGKNIDVFNDGERAKLVREVAKIVGPETAKNLNQLFLQLVKGQK